MKHKLYSPMQAAAAAFPPAIRASLTHLNAKTAVMPLRTRKIIYMTCALAGTVVWLPLSILAIPAMGLGLFGLIAISSLLRGIFVLPVVRRVRSYYSVPIGMGVFVMGSYIAIGLAVREALGTLMIPFI